MPPNQAATDLSSEDFHPFYDPFRLRPVLIDPDADPTLSSSHPILRSPLLTPLLFPNTSSDARDHLANERTFLSWLRLATYLAIVAVAILISFHLQSRPSALERRLAFPLGLIFWLLAIGCLVCGVGNYIRTVEKYARKSALVQSGLKTQVVFTVVAAAIVASCALFLGAEAGVRRR
ncbi:MAG: hypothetical protein Q9160_000581 [Pyrenula sp. 1 TL-2023]